MKARLNFVLGALGVLFAVGAISLFAQPFLPGTTFHGNEVIVFGVPILLLVIGVAIAYVGFYNEKSVEAGNSNLLEVFAWGMTYTVAIVIADYALGKLAIVDAFLVLLLTSAIVSVVAQIVRSHEHDFDTKWFIFYFLFYAAILLAVKGYFILGLSLPTGLFSALVAGFTLSGAYCTFQRIKVREKSIKWIAVVLLLVLLVSNLDSLQPAAIAKFMDQASSLSDFSGRTISPLDSLGNEQLCPMVIPGYMDVSNSGEKINPAFIGPILLNSINSSIWKVEGSIRNCYLGKYRDQHPDWFYCDDMILSRWAVSDAGTIRYRWYTAATAIWKPTNDSSRGYMFDRFLCEGGKRVEVVKGKPEYYVYESKDGTKINVVVSQNGTAITVNY